MVSSAGRFEPGPSVTLDAGGVANVKLRANGVGRASVTARGSGFLDAPDQLVVFDGPGCSWAEWRWAVWAGDS